MIRFNLLGLFFFLDLNYSATRPRSRGGVRLKIMTYVKFHFHVLSIMLHCIILQCHVHFGGGGGGGGGGGIPGVHVCSSVPNHD